MYLKHRQELKFEIDCVWFPLQLHDGIAAVQSDATLVVFVACHSDEALVSKTSSPAGRDDEQEKE